MILIVGLGNPGRKYEKSRHNLGFRVVDKMAESLRAPSWKAHSSKGPGESQICKGSHQGKPYLLAKPQTYMNESGQAVQSLLAYYKIPLEDVLVIVDDLDLDPGKIRQRNEGSDGGHRGLRSIIGAVCTIQFKRMRIGVGRPKSEDGRKIRANIVSFVLGRNKEEDELLENAVRDASRLAIRFLETGAFENWSS